MGELAKGARKGAAARPEVGDVEVIKELEYIYLMRDADLEVLVVARPLHEVR